MKEVIRLSNGVVTDTCYDGLKTSVEKAFFESSGEPQKKRKVRIATEKANSWLDFIAGKDDNLYYDNELRLFHGKGGEYVIVQGEEMDVDARGKRVKGEDGV